MKFYKKKTKTSKRKRSFKKKFYGKKASPYSGKEIMTFAGGNHRYMPQRFRTKLYMDTYGYFNSGSHAFFGEINANHLYTPFNVTGSFGSAGSNTTIELSPVGDYSPSGLSVLFGETGDAPYNAYCVYGCSLLFEMTTQELSHNIQVCWIPIDETGESVTVIDDAMIQPYNKQKVFYNGEKSPKLKMFLATHKFYGIRRQAMEDDLSGTFNVMAGTADESPIRTWNWQMLGQTLDGGNLGAKAPFRISLVYYVEFFSQTYAVNALNNPT